MKCEAMSFRCLFSPPRGSWRGASETYQFRIKRIAGEERLIAYDEELLASTGDGNIQFAVDEFAFYFHEIGKNVQFVSAGDGGAVDDDVFLTALIALNSVDENGVGF